MRAETDLLLAELAGLGLNPKLLQSERAGFEMVSVDLVKGLPCIINIAEPSRGLFNFSSIVSIPVTIGDHLDDLERVMSQLDDLLTPARLLAFGSEISLSIHGSWGTVEGLLRLCMESVLLHRRLAEHVLAPLLDFILDKSNAENTLTTIISGLAASTPAVVADKVDADSKVGNL